MICKENECRNHASIGFAFIFLVILLCDSVVILAFLVFIF